jgi:hypothetical protein
MAVEITLSSLRQTSLLSGKQHKKHGWMLQENRYLPNMFKVFYDNILGIKDNKGFNSYIVDLDIFKI